jgi:hypothetical protein
MILQAGNILCVWLAFACIGNTNAVQVVVNQWSTSDCEGSPSSITNFNMKNTSASIRGNESWPFMFQYVTQSYPIGSCTEGFTPYIGATRCCVTHLKSKYIVGRSISYGAVGLSPVGDYMPETANGVRYCYVQSVNQILPWYNDLYIRTGDCADGFYCDPAGILTVYNSGVCNDAESKGSQNVTVTAQPNNFSIAHRGNFTASAVIPSVSTLTIGWKAYILFSDLVPEYRNEPAEFLAIILSGLAFVAIFVTMNFFGRRFLRNMVGMDLLHVVGQMIWLLALTLNVIYIHCVIPDPQQLALLAAFSYGVKNFATLYCSLHSTAIVLGAAAVGKRDRVVCYASLLLLHFGCAGSEYTHYWRVFYPDSAYAGIIFVAWRNLTFLWLIVSEVSIFFPVFFLLYKLLLKKGRGSAEGTVWKAVRYMKIDRTFTALVMLSFSFIGMFAMLSIVDSSFIGFYGSERVRMSCQLVRICFQLLPFSINCFVTQHLPEMLAILKRMNVPEKKGNKQEVKAANEAQTRFENISMDDLQPPTVKLTHGDMY